MLLMMVVLLLLRGMGIRYIVRVVIHPERDRVGVGGGIHERRGDSGLAEERSLV